MLPRWNVTLFANGKIAVNRQYELTKRKDFISNRPLNSTISVSKQRLNFKSAGGLEIRLDTFATNENYAIKAGLTFLGYVIDILSHRTGLAIQLSLYPSEIPKWDIQSALREIPQSEFSECFDESRLLRLTEPAFLNAISWHRKGLCSENSIDKFLGFWNSIEVLAGNYHHSNERTKKGIKNQVWSIFNILYGEPENWNIIHNDDGWIDYIYSLRNEIFHGSGEIGQAEFIERIINVLPELETVSSTLLSNWRSNELRPERKITEEIRLKLDPEYWFYFESTATN